MRKALTIIVIAAVVTIALDALLAPGETFAGREAATGPIRNGISVYGLHVALPEYMTNFPRELVPLP
jgi:hypothetical protein